MNGKLTLCLLLLMLMGVATQAQVRPVCGTTSYLQRSMQQDPDLLKQRQAMLQTLNQLAANYEKDPLARKRSTVITIPVVVHVVYRNANQNISDAQIQSQIDVLNEDFRRMNADTANTPAAFRAVAADVEIMFCLAKRDPNGDSTSGITRTQTTTSRFSDNDAVKFDKRGGKNGWPRDQYLNIWVCNIDPDLLGYAQFPGWGAPATDGVVIGYQYFGRTGTLSPPYNKGRTTTHEVGHWLGLEHIWGDSFCGDDNVSDTPTQEDANYGCPSFPRVTCGNGPNGDMFMNYMDYTNDGCMNLFTAGQKSRMFTAIQTYRPGLLQSKGCDPVIVHPLDAAISAIQSPLRKSCSSTITPEVVLRNAGRQNLTSATIHYVLNGGAPQSYTWSGNLASKATVPVVLPAMPVSPGQHTLQVYVSQPNNGTDQDHANDTLSINFETIVQAPGLPLPFSEGFERTLFPPSGWDLENPDEFMTWERTTRARKQGIASAMLKNYDYNLNGESDELVLPALDLTAAPAPALDFALAYAMFNGADPSDTLEILVSTDCGRTYQSVYKKYQTALTTTATGIARTDFVPTTSEWRYEHVNLSQFASHSNVYIKFRNTTNYQNNIYIDDVRVGTVTGLKQDALASFIRIYPNPAQQYLELQIAEDVKASSVEVLDLLGKIVLRKAIHSSADQILNLEPVAAGLYLVRVHTDKGDYIGRVNVVK